MSIWGVAVDHVDCFFFWWRMGCTALVFILFNEPATGTFMTLMRELKARSTLMRCADGSVYVSVKSCV